MSSLGEVLVVYDKNDMKSDLLAGCYHNSDKDNINLMGSHVKINNWCGFDACVWRMIAFELPHVCI